MKGVVIIVAVLISAANLKTCNKQQSKEKSAKVTEKQILFDESMDIAPQADTSIKFTEVKIKGDKMEVKIKYLGCENDDFDLIFNKMWLKSFPPKANLFLVRKNGQCKNKAIHTKSYIYNLTNMRNNSSGEVYIKVMNYTEYFKYSYKK